MRMVSGVVCWILVSSCTPPVRSGHWGAVVTVHGDPATGDVLFVNGKGAVVADAPIVKGRYELAKPPVALTAVFRLETPAIGMREVQLRDEAPPSLAIERSDVVSLHAGIELPEGVAFDWVDLEIQPLEGSVSREVALWNRPRTAGSAMFKHQLTTPSAELKLLGGLYRIDASRIPNASQATPGPTLVLDHTKSRLGDSPAKSGAHLYQLGNGASLSEWFVLRRVR